MATQLAHPSPVLLAGGGVIAQIFYPLVYDGTRDLLAVVSVVLFAAAAVLHAGLTRGARTAVATLLVFGVGGLAIEVLGLATGFPFGRYQYGGGLGVRLFGVPLVVGLAWIMTAWPCWIAAGRLTGRRRNRVLLAAWGLAAWDLFLDPQMVQEGYWKWLHPTPGLPGVYGVPLTNHVGWLAVALLLMSVFAWCCPDRDAVPRPLDLVPIGTLLWIYFSSLLGHVMFFGLPFAAIWGALGMGVIAIPLVAGRDGLPGLRR
ncbi:MAG: carotenoid biosynthesis protein [Geodermatophilaceae bacterium]